METLAGVSTQVLTNDLAEATGLDKTAREFGCLRYFPIPFRKAALQAGDLIFRIDGQLIYLPPRRC